METSRNPEGVALDEFVEAKPINCPWKHVNGLSANCGTFKVSGIVCQNENDRKRYSCHSLNFDRTSAFQSCLLLGYGFSQVTLEMNPSARLNLDTGIFEVSDRQMADIAQQDLGVLLLRHAAISRSENYVEKNYVEKKTCEFAAQAFRIADIPWAMGAGLAEIGFALESFTSSASILRCSCGWGRLVHVIASIVSRAEAKVHPVTLRARCTTMAAQSLKNQRLLFDLTQSSDSCSPMTKATKPTILSVALTAPHNCDGQT
jgi:hypothetical protein